jgi:hypothetical protein
MAAGRPLKFDSVEQFESMIQNYFDICKEEKRPPTITGLALHLGTTRETLREYKERPEFVDSIKYALSYCESWLEENALMNKSNPTFTSFVLKNNYGWVDKKEIDSNAKVELKVDSMKELTNEELERITNQS